MGNEIFVIITTVCEWRSNDVPSEKKLKYLFRYDNPTEDEAVIKALEALKNRSKAEHDDMIRNGAKIMNEWEGERIVNIEILNNPILMVGLKETV